MKSSIWWNPILSSEMHRHGLESFESVRSEPDKTLRLCSRSTEGSAHFASFSSRVSMADLFGGCRCQSKSILSVSIGQDVRSDEEGHWSRLWEVTQAAALLLIGGTASTFYKACIATTVARSKQVYIEWMEATVLLTMKPRKRAATYRHKRYDQQNALPILYDSAGPALLPEATSFSWSCLAA
jgi:hypothetical protein